MKITSFSIFLIALAITAWGQGQVAFSNIQNGSPNPTATSDGLFWTSRSGAPALINQDFNAALYGGTNSSNLPLLSRLLLNNGSAIGDNPLPGYLIEPSGQVYT